MPASAVSGRFRGLTLVEVLVVIAILAVLAGLLMPAVQRVRAAAQQTGCRNNLRQIGLALQNHHNTCGHCPPGYSYDEQYQSPHGIIYNTHPGWGWAAHLLPQLEQTALADQIEWDRGVEDKLMKPVRTQALNIYVCPADAAAGSVEVFSQINIPLGAAATNSYAASFGYGGPIGEQPTRGNGVFYRNSQVRFSDISDGLSTTIAVGERAALFCPTPWAGAYSNGTARSSPNSPSFVAAIEEAPVMTMARTLVSPLNHEFSTPYDFYSPHHSVMHFLFVDGSARALPFYTSVDVLKAFGTRSGGETAPEGY